MDNNVTLTPAFNDLEQYFRNNTGRLLHKELNYFDVYERHFSRFRGKEIVVLEVGVSHGGSLQMWKHYFGDKAKIYGIDVDPRCKQLEEEQVTIFIGSQSDKKFLRDIKNTVPPIDILIDDGGHLMHQQRITFEALFDHVKPNGVYLCEDLHTSYWLRFGGGVRRRGTFIEYTKKIIDALHAYHSEQRALKVSDFTRTVKSVHYYDSIVVVEKGAHPHYKDECTGSPSFVEELGKSPSLTGKCWHVFKVMLNKALRGMGAGSSVRLPIAKWGTKRLHFN